MTNWKDYLVLRIVTGEYTRITYVDVTHSWCISLLTSILQLVVRLFQPRTLSVDVVEGLETDLSVGGKVKPKVGCHDSRFLVQKLSICLSEQIVLRLKDVSNKLLCDRNRDSISRTSLFKTFLMPFPLAFCCFLTTEDNVDQVQSFLTGGTTFRS